MMGEGTVTRDWGDGTQTFRLSYGSLGELEEKAGKPVIALYRDMVDSTWHHNVPGEIIRLGLIGGGMTPGAALALVRRYVHQEPLTANAMLAAELLFAVLYGPPSATAGKDAAPTTATETGDSISPSSTAPAP